MQATRKPKIVRIIARLNIGGPAQQACTLHDRLAENFQTHLIHGRVAAGEEEIGVSLSQPESVVKLPRLSREIALWSDTVVFVQILKLLLKERPQIVHTHTAKAGALGRVAAWLAGVPVVVHTYHGHVFDGYFSPIETKIYQTIERALARITTRVVVVSPSQAHELSYKYKIAPITKFSVVRNGFELNGIHKNRTVARERWGFSDSDLAIVWAGRMAPVKNVELLAATIKLARKRLPNARFLIAGDGSERVKLESEIGACSNARLVGWQEDMHKVWPAADVALLTSKNEGTPTVLIEAMAAGVPFVATNVGGVADLAAPPVEHASRGSLRAANGFLTECRPDSLIDSIEQIAKDPHRLTRMGEAGREFALRNHSLDRFVDSLESLYRELLDEARHSNHGTS